LRQSRAAAIGREEADILSAQYNEVSASAMPLPSSSSRAEEIDYLHIFNTWPEAEKSRIFAHYFSDNYDDHDGFTITSRNGRNAHLFRFREPLPEGSPEKPRKRSAAAEPNNEPSDDAENGGEFRNFIGAIL